MPRKAMGENAVLPVRDRPGPCLDLDECAYASEPCDSCRELLESSLDASL
jgi:hypothetical protein